MLGKNFAKLCGGVNGKRLQLATTHCVEIPTLLRMSVSRLEQPLQTKLNQKR